MPMARLAGEPPKLPAVMTPEEQLCRWQLVIGADVGAIQYIPAVEELQVSSCFFLLVVCYLYLAVSAHMIMAAYGYELYGSSIPASLLMMYRPPQAGPALHAPGLFQPYPSIRARHPSSPMCARPLPAGSPRGPDLQPGHGPQLPVHWLLRQVCAKITNPLSPALCPRSPPCTIPAACGRHVYCDGATA